ncbi:nuclear division RFT1-like protein, partial [Trifolium pratense]
MVPETNFSDMVTGSMLTSDMGTADVQNYSSGFQVGTSVKRKKLEDSCCTDGVVNISKGISSTNSVQ